MNRLYRTLPPRPPQNCTKLKTVQNPLGDVTRGYLCLFDACTPDKKYLGQNVDVGLVSSRIERANQTQINICSPKKFLQMIITSTFGLPRPAGSWA